MLDLCFLSFLALRNTIHTVSQTFSCFHFHDSFLKPYKFIGIILFFLFQLQLELVDDFFVLLFFLEKCWHDKVIIILHSIYLFYWLLSKVTARFTLFLNAVFRIFNVFLIGFPVLLPQNIEPMFNHIRNNINNLIWLVIMEELAPHIVLLIFKMNLLP